MSKVDREGRRDEQSGQGQGGRSVTAWVGPVTKPREQRGSTKDRPAAATN